MTSSRIKNVIETLEIALMQYHKDLIGHEDIEIKLREAINQWKIVEESVLWLESELSFCESNKDCYDCEES